MSKGHMEALQALKALRAIGQPTKAAVKKPQTVTRAIPQTVTLSAEGGRGKKVHGSPAEKQKAYRDRKKAKA